MNGQRTWAEISMEALADNYYHIRSKLTTRYLAVVKANAYGHGDTAIANELQRLGADWFGVATVYEGMALRDSGITKPILVFGYTAVEDAALLSEYHITQALFSKEYGLALSAAAKAAGVTVDCHLKLDTGMHRIGFDVRSNTLAADIREACGDTIRITGTFTHFAVADELSPQSLAFTRQQLASFKLACQTLQDAGIPTGLLHCANSAGAIMLPEAELDMVRVGISQYGFAPSDELAGQLQLTPVMTFCSTVAMVKEILPGDTVSYGRQYTAQEPRKIATVTAGYADGYPRMLGGLANVIIRGQYAPVLGRVCMDQLMADVTNIPGVTLGDRVVLAGRDGDCEVSFEQLAALTHTVHYERICAISTRVPRIYMERKDPPEATV
ncbi:MAG: alanine racemase [Angelakisella sp.]